MNGVETFKGAVGRRVKLHPATDLWMMGHRYGTVERVGGRWVYVRLDAGQVRKILPMNLQLVPEWQRIPNGGH